MTRLAAVPGRSLPRDLAEVLLVALLLALFARTWTVQAFRVPSDSMAPGLMAGDHILVNKFVFRATPSTLLPARPVRRGDVVVFRRAEEPRQVLVKRCVAESFDRVEIVDKQLILNGDAKLEPYVVHSDRYTYPSSRFLEPELRHRDNLEPLRVPSGHLLCLGDNRDESQDSRLWGAIPTSGVIGQARLVWWSRGETQPPELRGNQLARSRFGRAWAQVMAFGASFRRDRLLLSIR